MKVALTIVCLFLLASVSAQDFLRTVRKIYQLAGIEEDSLKKLSLLLSPVNYQSAPVLLCYKGAATMIKANYTYNPIKEFRAFSDGKKLIEKSLSLDSTNIESRYVRFTLQTNLPRFLGYGYNIEGDKKYILDNYQRLTDTAMQNMILSYFKKSKYCSKEDIKKLTND